MKRSQIILGASAFVLAIASAFTSKAKFANIVKTFITINSQVFTISGSGCTTGLAKDCKWTTASQVQHQVYGVTAGNQVVTLQKIQ